MTDCSSIQGSTTSSSSDVTTLTTASSWCAISPSSRIRVIRLIRPNPRCVLVTPNNNPSFGFSIRGGKEFGTGFFVSNVERYSEANQKGLKIGDQLLRMNGYRVEDAVHKELVQYISSQDRLTLKVRGVGMLPLKEKDNDPLTWRAVRTSDHPSSNLSCSEDPFKAIINKRDHKVHSKDKRVVLNVAPRTKLGLGICKGPEWKPGIFVQFTKSKSVAREAGLRPGDQILCVNSIDFSDVLFSEAVAVMKSSNKLDMVVRTAAGCDLFPGESSGYNSSASSVTGDQSPCWADISAKRLTVVREEPPVVNCNSENLYADVKKISRSAEHDNYSLYANDTGTLKELNKTIIKLTESGTSINNTFIEDPRITMVDRAKIIPPVKAALVYTEKPNAIKPSALNPMPPPPPPSKFSTASNPSQASGLNSSKASDVCFVSRQSETKTVIVEVHRTPGDSSNKNAQQLTFASPDYVQGDVRSGKQPEVDNNTFQRDICDNGTSLCSAIAEELKKRKEKQRVTDGHSNHNNTFNNIPRCNNQIGHPENPLTRVTRLHKKLGASVNTIDRNGGDQHSALMDEFKRAHQRMFKNGFQENDHKERQDVLRNTVIMDNKDERVEEEQEKVSHNPQTVSETTKSISSQLSTDSVDSKAQQPKYEMMDKFAVQRKFTQFNTKPESQKPPSSPVPDYEPVQMRLTPSEQRYSKDFVNVVNAAGTSSNRRTMLLDTVTIGEYSQNSRKDPVKFDFLPQKNHAKDDKHYLNMEETSLRSELQDTLSRSNLKKTSASSSATTLPLQSNVLVEQLEHRSHCQLHNKNHININSNSNSNGNHNNNKEYTNVEKLTRMLQSRQDDDASSTRSVASIASRNQTANLKFENTGNGGILKNGNSKRSSCSSFSKNSEKSISFGN